MEKGSEGSSTSQMPIVVVLDIYDGLPFDNDEEKTNIAKVSDLLEKYFIGETNETYERLPVGDVSRVRH